jgi:hypothetical protein
MQSSSKVKGVVDIVFVIDITGSMQHCIDALKENISTFIDSLTTPGSNVESPVNHWRAKVVGYRDYRCDDIPLVDNPFVEDSTSLKMQLTRLSAEGGGDEPESLLDALYVVARQPQSEPGAQELNPNKWRYRSDAARVVIAFTDATYHKSMTVESGNIDDVINAIHENRIILSLYAPEMDCHDEIAAADRSEYFAIPWDRKAPNGAQKALKDFTCDQENFRKTLEMLAKSVSQSAGVPLD